MRNTIRNTKVEEIRTLLVEEAALVKGSDSIDTVIDRLLENPLSRHVYVVDEKMKMIGSIRLNNIIEFIFPFDTIWLQENYDKYIDIFYRETAEELMEKNFVFVHKDTDLSEMVKLMNQNQINELPVLDENHRVIGEVNFLEVLRFIQNRREK